MGGALEVKSTPGKGSVFSFDSVPLRRATTLVSPIRGQRILGVAGVKRKVLVVDDDPTNRQLLSDMLTPLGFDIREAGDGQAAFTHAAAWRPDVILMDMRMPVMDGFEAIRRIRATEALHTVVIFAVSASVFDHNRQQCLEAGADSFLRKPCRLEELTDLLRKHLGLEWVYEPRGFPTPATEAPSSPFPLPESARTILLDLARRGDIKRILAAADRPRPERPPLCSCSARDADVLAKGFQVKRLCQWLEVGHPTNPSELPRSQLH